MRDIGNKFLNNVEISAQEAGYIALQISMRKSSCQVVFINTLQEIKDLEDESDEIYANGFINRYTNRPANLKNLSLADWAAWYDSHNKSYIKPCYELDIDNCPLETNMLMTMWRMKLSQKIKKVSKCGFQKHILIKNTIYK